MSLIKLVDGVAVEMKAEEEAAILAERASNASARSAKVAKPSTAADAILADPAALAALKDALAK